MDKVTPSQMVQIGTVTWVTPSRVVAIEWDGYTERMPLVYVEGGRKLTADYYQSEKTERRVEVQQESINRLMSDLRIVQGWE